MIFDSLPTVDTVEGLDPGAIPDWVFESDKPLLLRGLVRDWPATAKGNGDLNEMKAYLERFWTPEPVTAYVAGPEVAGRYGYNKEFNGFNFRSGSAPLADIFDRLHEQERADEDKRLSIYVGSTPVDNWLPGFLDENPLNIPTDQALINFWLGNRTTVSAHYDFPSNIACVLYGERRFTLFPIDQIDNLYVGPVDRTPSGQPISLVDFDAPDFDAFPRFRQALEHAQTALLGPGDAIFIPSLWWHHVKALTACNLLVNYWWLTSADYMGSPKGALLHSIMSIRNLPEAQRRGWQTLMNHYVFDAEPDSTAHIPEQALGCLGPMTEHEAGRLRSELINRLKH